MSTSTTLSLLLVVAGLAYVSLGQQQAVDPGAVEQAVMLLARHFKSLRADKLGAEVLEAEFHQYAPELGDVLEEDSIGSLVDSSVGNLVKEVINDLQAVQNIGQMSSTNETLLQCCVNSSSLCCYSCSSHNFSSLLIEAGDFFSSSLAASFSFFHLGLPDGTLLIQRPVAPPVSEECAELDSRLQPWYMVATASQPKAVAIVVYVSTEELSPLVKAAVGNVIQSLSPNDTVSMTLIMSGVRSPIEEGLSLANTCTKTRLLEVLANPELPFTSNLVFVLQKYAEILNSLPVKDRILLFATDTSDTSSYGFNADFIFNISQAIITSNINLQVYLANGIPAQGPLNDLVNATNTSIKNLEEIGGYYSHLIIQPSNASSTLQVATAFNAYGELSLSITGVLVYDQMIQGVVNAQLSWKTLLEEVYQSLTGRPHSYVFVVDSERNILYHDSSPGVITVGLSPSLFEPEEAFFTVLDSVALAANISITVPVTKTVLLPRTGKLEGSYLLKHLPATYNCRKSMTYNGGVWLYTCLVLAQEDMALITGRNTVNVSEIYSGTPSREPILHTAVADLSDSSSCSYFCHSSSNDRISLQLTSPIETLAADEDIMAYINGSGPLPDGVSPGTAEEVAILSSVSETWLHGGYSQLTSLLHRHVATPTGVYLQYPPLSLVDAFKPQELMWYQGAVSLEDELALSPPSMDLVSGGKVYDASWPLRDNNMQLLAVLAATSTVSSLQMEVNKALDGLCGRPDYDCMIINDEGFFILNPREFPDDDYLTQVQRYSPIGLSLLNGVNSGDESFILQKRGCNDFVSGGYNQFYWLNRANSNATCGNTTTYDYCIQKIPESNAFLMVVKSVGGSAIGLCFSDCLGCPVFSETAVSCLCSCERELCDLTVIDADVFNPCPTSGALDPNYTLASIAQVQRSDFCWDASQCCSLDQGSCESLATCSWCPDSAHCIPIGACCTGDNSCCFELSSCFAGYCSAPGTNRICPLPPPQVTSPSPSPSMDVSNINTEAAIIGGVVGGIFAIFLLAMLIVCCVWYQIFRAPVDENHKEKGVFDLTGIRADATNQTAIEVSKKPDEQPVSPAENGEAVKQDLSAEGMTQL